MTKPAAHAELREVANGAIAEPRHGIRGTTRVVSVWGDPVSHSRSPVMHNAALAAMGLDWVYVSFHVTPDSVPAAVAALRALQMVGTNVTVPLKELVIPHLDSVDPDAARIGSVNTIVNRDGFLTGYSTDGPGILWDLERRGISVAGNQAVIWGAGGSARAIAFALADSGCRVSIANRTLSRAADLASAVGNGATAIGWGGADYAEAVRGADLLVNATSLGMEPRSVDESPPIPAAGLRAGQVVYDIVYKPAETKLLIAARAAGCIAIGGLGMLACQGAVSLSLWSGRPLVEIPVIIMLDALGI